MKAHTASLINAIILISMAGWGYLSSENPSMTALIPVFFGIVLILLNNGLKKENKIIAHIVVILTLVIIIALFKPLIGAINESRQLAIVRVGLMILSSLWAMFYFIKNFIDARKSAS